MECFILNSYVVQKKCQLMRLLIVSFESNVISMERNYLLTSFISIQSQRIQSRRVFLGEHFLLDLFVQAVVDYWIFLMLLVAYIECYSNEIIRKSIIPLAELLCLEIVQRVAYRSSNSVRKCYEMKTNKRERQRAREREREGEGQRNRERRKS